jgi:hypothetical protein
MRKFVLIYWLLWIPVSLLYFMSCFDGVYSERLYSTVETVTLPWSLLTSKWGIGLETRSGFSIFMLIARYALEVVLPALLDFGLIYAIRTLWKKSKSKGSDASA